MCVRGCFVTMTKQERIVPRGYSDTTLWAPTTTLPLTAFILIGLSAEEEEGCFFFLLQFLLNFWFWQVGQGTYRVCALWPTPGHSCVGMVLDNDLDALFSLLPSDYIIEEKDAVLQKKENEGFGFVLRGAKAETPIEEFTPTPAFPALQYLESVDVEGVAWRAGLRTGDFLIEVNGVNVVKVGHKQVVSLIRQGGNSLLMKVVSVTRKPESEDVVRKKGEAPCCSYIIIIACCL
ncbi:hypothetical protein NFI96_008093 [Prochilodus magdalenae]|nr:hypothetical protein NFI96_008093 [Prochilodus magdalenae]